MLDAFDATRHPQVVSGCQAPDVVFRDFVEGFLAGLPSNQRASVLHAMAMASEKMLASGCRTPSLVPFIVRGSARERKLNVWPCV